MTVVMSNSVIGSFLRDRVGTFVNTTNWTTTGGGSNAGTIVFCGGDYPTDAQIRGISSVSDAMIANNTIASSTQVFSSSIVQNAASVKYTMNPTTKTFTALKDGVISWALVYFDFTRGFAIFDVTEINGGGMMQLDSIVVNTGSTFVLADWTFILGV